jgi:hypothetical protein
MMKSLSLILVSWAFIGCSAVPQELADTTATDGMVNVTKTESCQGTTPVGTNVYHSWHMDMKSSTGDEEQHTMTVEGNAVGFTTTCKYGNTQVSVTARANASVTPNLIQTTSNDSQEVTTSSGNANRTCKASVSSGLVMTYTFQGPCLKVMNAGQTQLMLPQ